MSSLQTDCLWDSRFVVQGTHQIVQRSLKTSILDYLTIFESYLQFCDGLSQLCNVYETVN